MVGQHPALRGAPARALHRPALSGAGHRPVRGWEGRNLSRRGREARSARPPAPWLRRPRRGRRSADLHGGRVLEVCSFRPTTTTAVGQLTDCGTRCGCCKPRSVSHAPFRPAAVRPARPALPAALSLRDRSPPARVSTSPLRGRGPGVRVTPRFPARCACFRRSGLYSGDTSRRSSRR
jgi:hypothetical protein